jgi:hypothetical protein
MRKRMAGNLVSLGVDISQLKTVRAGGQGEPSRGNGTPPWVGGYFGHGRHLGSNVSSYLQIIIDDKHQC